MKNDNEKKSIVKSVKISPNQLAVIEQKAKEKGMNFSEYMIASAVHGSDGMTPVMAVKIQELVNIVRDIADNLDSRDYMKREELRQKADFIEGLSTYTPPQEKLERLENNMGIFIEEGLDIWEYLK